MAQYAKGGKNPQQPATGKTLYTCPGCSSQSTSPGSCARPTTPNCGPRR